LFRSKSMPKAKNIKSSGTNYVEVYLSLILIHELTREESGFGWKGTTRQLLTMKESSSRS
ncbi:MAG: hypothetical protein AAF740_01085, partial [Bacteroidota bacterium]